MTNTLVVYIMEYPVYITKESDVYLPFLVPTFFMVVLSRLQNPEKIRKTKFCHNINLYHEMS